MSSSGFGIRNALKAKIYSGGPAHIYAPAYRKIAKPLSSSEGPFLDLGCGSGALVAEIAKGLPDSRVVGIDRNPAAAKDAASRVRGLIGAEILAMDGESMNFPPQSFQTVFALQNLMHWKNPDAVMAQVFRVLRPGGQFRIYQAGGGPIPVDWIQKTALGWPSDTVLRIRWKRYQPSEKFLKNLPGVLSGVGFSKVERTREGFYRKWVAVK